MKLKHLIPLAALAAGISQQSLALTASGTAVDNTAQLNYTIGGSPQPEVDSNTANFVVDRLVTFTLASPSPVLNAATTVIGTLLANTFTLNNTSNAEIKFQLSSIASNNDGTTGDDTPAVVGSEGVVFKNSGGTQVNATDVITIAAETSATFTVEITPLIGSNDNIFNQVVTATAVDGTPGSYATITADTGVWTPASVQTLLDPTEGATRSANGAVQVSAPELTVTKVVTVLDDNNTATTFDSDSAVNQEKSVPGARVEYTITVTNDGDEIAPSVVVTDVVDTDLETIGDFETAITGGATTTAAASGAEASGTVTFVAVDVPAAAGGTAGEVVFKFQADIK